MKILHTEASCGWGGQEIRILSEASGMLERGHDVLLACPPEAQIFEAAHKRGLRVQALPIARKSIAGWRAVKKLLLEMSFDVVNTHSSTDTWLTALACASLRSPPPLVRTRHISAPISRSLTSRWLYSYASAHVATTGEALRRDVIAATGISAERVTSVPTGIDTALFIPGDRLAARRLLGLNESAPMVGIVATLRSWKGHRFLVDAIARLPNEVTLVIVGDGPQHEALQAQIDNTGQPERFLMPGNREDVQLWLQAFDLFVLPSYANEGVPQALMQAMSAGLPCITTQVGAIGEIAHDEDTAIVVKPQDIDALVVAMQRVLGDSALAQGLGSRARQFVVKHHGRESMLDKMEAIFRAVQA